MQGSYLGSSPAFASYIDWLKGLAIMESNFILQVIKVTFYLTMIVSPVIGYYMNEDNALGVLLGSFWGMANIYFLKKSLKEWLKVGHRNYLLFYTFIQLKFPLLYLAGYGLLKVFPALYLVVGSSLPFAAIFFLGLYRAITEESSQTKGLV